ncbi:MAG TPA: exodeoxyribonuclease VII small subunit [Thermoanaerobacterales bacterium]|uniref:exodeoxyribonuclease VII small subunit n=1 Tax=Tepidanaerobacter sp. GT38 TaxID=2722793 RepID=UPI001801673A|nr:exodeoxyribonuclease VII small subunit [Tepidanaerobacter sp. GT38]MCG1012679.1 exodeoxyribonuclease VII small subunit [Tepidanaerobacter sp. GT38]HHY42032.1 exodeoxyribonuclease VII small subunit [Thermoanaerobacterales bacterium]
MTCNYKYEEALSRLEYITEQLEKGDLTLDEALTFFEEGIKLVKICSKMLDEAEGKIEILTKDLEGNITIKDFNGGSELLE